MNARLEQFLKTIAENSELAVRLRAATTFEEATKLAEAAGCPLESGDLSDATSVLSNSQPRPR